MSERKPAFPCQLRIARHAAGLSISAAANRLGVSQPAWSQWESGEREPSFDRLLAIAKLLKTTPNALLGLRDDGGDAAGVAESKKPGRQKPP